MPARPSIKLRHEYRSVGNVAPSRRDYNILEEAMRAVDVIMKKRDGESLTREEIAFVISGYVKGDIPDYQVSALLMAIFFNGMSFEETAALTELMLHSGDVMHLEGLPGPFVDKHSTGGVGDKLSLVLAPMVASCGVKVPMMSGRALGHTGGTLDKLESIKGFKTQLDEAKIGRASCRERV